MVTTIHRDELLRLAELPELQLLEVLPAEDFAEAHLPRAINIPLKELDSNAVSFLDKSAPTVVY